MVAVALLSLTACSGASGDSGDSGAEEARKQELMGKVREMVTELKYLGVSEENLLTLLRGEEAK